MNTDYYKILGINQDADEKQIKKAYKELAMKYHPDHNKDDKVAEEKFKEINAAYQVLGDPAKKQAYDLGILDNNANFDIQSQINEILKNAMGINIDISKRKDVSKRIQIKHPIYISLHDAVFGCEQTVKVPSYIKCIDCNGDGGNKAICHKCKGAGMVTQLIGTIQYSSSCITCNSTGSVLTTTCRTCNREGFKKKYRNIKVKIPHGIHHNSIMRIHTDSNDMCEIYLLINVETHPKITRNGATLYSVEHISCIDAMIGGTKMVEVIDGKAEIIIPPGTQNKQHLIIENRGGVLDGNKRGNHIVEVSINIPKNLTEKQKNMLINLRNELKDN